MTASGGAAATTQLMYEVSGAFWGVGAVFFGLWLIPMGYLVLTSRWMPRPLGLLLVGGGAGYILSVFVSYLVPGAPGMVGDALTGVATLGELWMTGYLLVKGVRRQVAGPSVPSESLAG